jgi:hypothetical protein
MDVLVHEVSCGGQHKNPDLKIILAGLSGPPDDLTDDALRVSVTA